MKKEKVQKEIKFKNVVKAMTIKEIVMAMINGLRNPHVEVNMGTYGDVKDNICFGCAATNTVCEITGKTFTAENIEYYKDRANFIGTNIRFLILFEEAINDLRTGQMFSSYNRCAKQIGIAKVPYINERSLPRLTTDYSKEELDVWEQWANTL